MSTTTTAGPAEAAEELRSLFRSGRLAAAYRDLPRLLKELSEDQLLPAGQLLSRIEVDEVLRAHPGQPTITIAVTGHGTLSSLVPALTVELARHGVLLRPFVGEFDSYVFDLADPGSALYAAAPALVACVLDAKVVFDEVPLPWTPADVARALDDKLRLIEQLAARFESDGRGTLLLNTLPLPYSFAAQLVDHRSRAVLGAVWREANARLLRLAERNQAVVVLDLDPLIAEGVPVSDPRMSVYAKAHLSTELLARYAREAAHLARGLLGRTKKVLVVDLDETLWGGILGEEGPDGIEVAGSYRGEAFRSFQRVVKQLTCQGVLLAAVSKNEAETVRQVLRDHPDMVLREDDFVRVVANWRPKSENIRELAQALNLNADSFVFIDDSPYERGLVSRELPEVAVIAVDGEPALHAARLLADGWFDTREVTEADRGRTEKYREELVRADFLHTFSSLDDYLRELEVTVRLAAVAERELPRVSQITLRTNQFNLTTRRLQQAEVRRLAQGPDTRVLAIHSADRFGDNGLVGVVFTRTVGERLHIDNFLLSCRVFSRGIEQACLAAVLRQAAGSGARAVVGTYRKSAKNGVVKDFYPRHGFTPVDRTALAEPGEAAGAVDDDDATEFFVHRLVDPPAVPDHISLTASFEGDAW
ncbi:HAD-IIIC family phosphatase [Streptomyces sp. AK02-01A]|nr:HAD-IIIC family phosphatase [Streptomyces sp. AK02-01A]MDX3854946.1 HAD-IIIC family phosphatase [Streptomyces sp. AK02-01A]